MADFDQRISDALATDETFQGILAQLKAAAESEVLVRDDTPCKKCDCKHIRMVSVPDYKTKLAIMEFLANRGVGRPQQAEGESGERIVFKRLVKMEETD
ncbi:MAG TPA: hypothetical protein VIY48_08435 [Candidatus Paceibacterota bacterium]